MIPHQQTPINWPMIGLIVTIVLTAVGWFVSHRLTIKREKMQQRERFRKFISDFQFTANKWAEVIADKNEALPSGCGVALNGMIDQRAIALKRVRAASIEELATGVMAIRAHLTGNPQLRLDNEWKNYKEYEIEGVEMKDPATGNEFTSHKECKNGLIASLEQMKQIAGSIEI